MPVEYKDLVIKGKTLEKIDVNGTEEITFYVDTGERYKMYHD